MKIMPSNLTGRSSSNTDQYMFCILYFTAKLSLTCAFDPVTNAFICANSTVTSQGGFLISHQFSDVYENKKHCGTVISVKDASAIELSFEHFHTESVSDLNLLNEMCTLDYLEIINSDRTWRICGDWRGREHLLYFIFQGTSINVRFHSNNQTAKSGFVMKWVSTVVDKTLAQTPCLLPLFETETSCFELIHEPLDWVEGHNSCRKRGATLARVDRHATHQALQTNLIERNVSMTSVWIGAHDRLFEGDYMWTDRTAVNFQNWFPGWMDTNVSHAAGQPSDDGFSNEDCVEMRRLFSFPGKGAGLTETFFWNDRNCQEKNPFICEHNKKIQKRSTTQEPLQCSAVHRLTYEAPSIVVTSPGFPAAYPKLASCHVIITAPFGMQIYVDFTHMDIEDSKECEYDNVTISQITGTNAPMGIIRCGNWNTKLKLLRWTSEMNVIKISFNSDNTKQFSGFEAKVALVNKSSQCMDLGDSGTVGMYGPGGCWFVENSGTADDIDAACAGLGVVSAQDLIENKNFVGHLLGLKEGCSSLWTARNVTSNTSNDHVTDVGSIRAVCDIVTICKLKDVDNILVEYEAAVSQVPCANLNHVVCKKPTNESSKKQTYEYFNTNTGIVDNYCIQGETYDNNVHVIQKFETPVGTRIVFEISQYDIEYQVDCLYDYIETKGMVEGQRYCGSFTNITTLVSESNTAFIEFVSDEDVAKCGYNITWYTIHDGVVFETEMPTVTLDNIMSGFVNNVNFPRAFPDAINNCTTLRATKDHRIVLELTHLHMPGGDCMDSELRITSVPTSASMSFCGGTDLRDIDYIERFYVSADDTVEICFAANGLNINEGFRAIFDFEPKNETLLARNFFIKPGDHLNIASLFYPDWFPASLMQEIEIITEIGFAVVIDTINITIGETNPQQCSSDLIEIIDTSLSHSGKKLKQITCQAYTNKTISTITDTMTQASFLNSLKLVVSSGYHGNDQSTMLFQGNISSVTDPLFLNKTKTTTGSFNACRNNTCKNDGYCTQVSTTRYKCTCDSRFTGLFCQVTKCELKPCKHGQCIVTDTGYACICDSNYFGDVCEMDSILCQYKRCSANGRCDRVNETTIRCLCDIKFSGSTCDMPVESPEDNLTIGQKLLKEPIWIGMIVMLNLLIFFCVTYAIRQKCGRRIAQLLPKPHRKSVTKEDTSKTDPSPGYSADRRSLYSIHLDTPHTDSGPCWSPSITISRINRDKESTSVPSTPVIDEDNKEAALKMFAAYNSRKENVTPTITSIQHDDNNSTPLHVRDIMSCGIQGGSVTFNKYISDVERDTGDRVNGILRSYTISSEIRDFQSRRMQFKREERRASSYGGSTSANFKWPSKYPNKDTDINETRHCYPVIKIINENNVEESRNSDSDGSIIECNNDAGEDTTRVQEIKPPDIADSGYPSTTTMSNTTQSSSQVDDVQAFRMKYSASERRKMFSSNYKSSSFYNIGTIDGHEMPVVNDVQTCSPKDRMPQFDRSDSTNTTTLKFDSFESDRCRSCEREKVERLVHSYESDLDKINGMRKRQYTYDNSSYHTKSRHNRHRHKYGCSKCHRHFLKEAPHPRHPFHSKHNSNFSLLSYKSNDELLSNRLRHPTETRSMISSSESEPHSCSLHEPRRRRKNYRARHGAYSENGYGHRQNMFLSFDMQPYDTISGGHTHSSYKSKQMHSFLKDAYKSKYHGYRGTSSFASNGSHHSHSHGCDARRTIYQCDRQRRSHSRSPSPNELYNSSKRDSLLVDRTLDSVDDIDSYQVQYSTHPSYSNSTRYRLTDYDVSNEFMEQNKMDNEDEMSLNLSQECKTTYHDAEQSVISDRNISNTDDSLTNFSEKDSEQFEAPKRPIHDNAKQKDSAYQTKQSSVDRFSNSNSIKHKKGSYMEGFDLSKPEDKVHRHLHQAAMKLALIKRLEHNKAISKDSAVHTFSEDDLSADDGDTRMPLRPAVSKRTNLGLGQAFQSGLSLSQVKEELSGLSRETETYNTPTNEPIPDGMLERQGSYSAAISMTEFSTNDQKSIVKDVIASMEETCV